VTETTIVEVETRTSSTKFTVDYAARADVATVVTDYAEHFDGMMRVKDDGNEIHVEVGDSTPAEHPATAIERYVVKELGPEVKELTRKASPEEAAAELERRRWIEDNN
jgi:hypothetical protein